MSRKRLKIEVKCLEDASRFASMKTLISFVFAISLPFIANAQYSPWQCVSNGNAEFLSPGLDSEHYPKFCSKIQSKDECKKAEAIVGPAKRINPCKWIDTSKPESLSGCVGIKKSNDKSCGKLGHDRESCEGGLIGSQYCRWHDVGIHVNQSDRRKPKEKKYDHVDQTPEANSDQR